MFSPRYSMRPAAGSTPPPMALSSVVLPAPFGPTIVTNSPSPTSSDTSASACSPPYATLSPETLSIGRRNPLAEPALAEIGLDDGRIAHDVGGQAVGDAAAVVEDDQAVHELHDGVHRVLDDHHAHARIADAAHESGHRLHPVARQAGERLVEQDQIRRARQA